MNKMLDIQKRISENDIALKNTILKIAEENQKKAWDVINQTGIIFAWESAGAEIHLVGSLKTGLLMKHLDIDFHCYSDLIDIAQSFEIMSKIASVNGVERLEYRNLLATEEKCLEFHFWYRHSDENLWQIDLIQLQKGSRYDGYFERVADRIAAVLTPERRQTILFLKNETPNTEKIPGILYYQAVIQDGIQTWSEFCDWRRQHSDVEIVEWMP